MPGPRADLDPITDTLRALNAGEQDAQAKLWSLVYEQMRALANRHRVPERDLLHQTTDVVHSVFEILARQRQTLWQSRSHFFGIAAIAMRRIVVDWARKAERQPPHGDDGEEAGATTNRAQAACAELLDLETALVELERRHPRCARVVEMRYFADVGFADIAAELSISERTAANDWAFARAWLKRWLAR